MIFSGPAAAQEVTLRLQHAMSPVATAHTQFFMPFKQALEEKSGGRIELQIFPAMQLGGSPAQMHQQARDGVVDMTWTLIGYTPGRFPVTELFELPFVGAESLPTSLALMDFAETHLAREFRDVKLLMAHTHPPGVIHTREGSAITRLEDLSGVKLRTPSPVVTDIFEALGGTSVGMPVTEITQAISRGVVDGTVLPWEGAGATRIVDLTRHHTGMGGPNGVYTAVLILVMNRRAYDRLPDDLRAIVDAETGRFMVRRTSAIWDQASAGVRAEAEALGHQFHLIEGAELERWKRASQPVIDEWVEKVTRRGVDGAALLAEARALIAQYRAEAGLE